MTISSADLAILCFFCFGCGVFTAILAAAWGRHIGRRQARSDRYWLMRWEDKR